MSVQQTSFPENLSNVRIGGDPSPVTSPQGTDQAITGSGSSQKFTIIHLVTLLLETVGRIQGDENQGSQQSYLRPLTRRTLMKAVK